MAEYSISYAPSGRASCKNTKCKKPIPKDSIRITVSTQGPGDFTIDKHYHAECAPIAKKYGKNFENFLTDEVHDRDGILAEKLDEVLAMRVRKQEETKATPKSKNALLAKLEEALENKLAGKGSTEGEEPSKKKVKTEEKAENFDKLLQIFEKHKDKKAGELKEILGWNNQLVSGNKESALFRVIDGEYHGRLGLCPLDDGRLKFSDDLEFIVCPGVFNEDAQRRIPCSFKCERLSNELERLEWFTDEPSEEQKEAIKNHEQVARGEVMEESEEADAVLKKAKKIKFDLETGPGKVKAAEDFVELFSGEYELDINQSEAKRFFGSFINGNLDLTPVEIAEKLIQEKGFRSKKEQKAEKKEGAAKNACAEPKNAPILRVFQELLSFYSKEGNTNATASYAKVCAAIAKVDYPITAANAMGLSKGKTKVEGIGRGSAEKMKEFCETGKIEKLEEKRAGKTD